MSGGHFDYSQYRIEDIATEIDELINSNNNTSDKYSYSYSDDIIEKFQEAAHTLRQSAEMAQRVDWLVSGDDSDESFIRRWGEDVRPYWSPYKPVGEIDRQTMTQIIWILKRMYDMSYGEPIDELDAQLLIMDGADLYADIFRNNN